MQRHDIDVLALQETKAREDQLPLMGLQALGLRHRGGRAQPVERRRAAVARRAGGRRGRLRRHAAVRRPCRRRGARDRRHLRRRARLVALRPQRPQARRPALRLQARLAGPPARDRARLARRPDRAGRRLEHLPDRRRRLRRHAVREVDPRDAARAGRVPGLPRRRLGRDDARARAGLHLLGLLPPALRARPRAQDRLRARLARARRAGHAAPSSTATSATPRRAPGRRPTTRRWSSTWTEGACSTTPRRSPARSGSAPSAPWRRCRAGCRTTCGAWTARRVATP